MILLKETKIGARYMGALRETDTQFRNSWERGRMGTREMSRGAIVGAESSMVSSD
jgi:hypothetical protein